MRSRPTTPPTPRRPRSTPSTRRPAAWSGSRPRSPSPFTELPSAGLTLEAIVGLFTWRPAAIAGLTDHGGPVVAGRVANLCVFDPHQTWTVDPARTASRSRNNPFAGRTLTGRVRHTILQGDPVVIDAEAQR